MHAISRALCATVLLGSTAAHAAYVPVIDATGFTIGKADFAPFVELTKTAETANSTTFSLHKIAAGLQTATDSSHEPVTVDYRSWSNYYGFTVKDGYQITGIAVTGYFHGELDPAEGTTPGKASNRIKFNMYTLGYPVLSGTSQIDGQLAFSLNMAGMPREGEFGLWFDGSSEARAESAWYRDEAGVEHWLGSRASGGLGGLEMTVTVAAVPEPGTWAMLAVGLAVLGRAGQLRRRASAA